MLVCDHDYIRSKFNRRHFLQATLAVAAGQISGGRLAGFDPYLMAAEIDAEMLPIIDTHQHLWDLTKFKLAWISPKSPLDRSYLLSDYNIAAKGLNIVKSVYMEVDVVPEQQADEAEYVVDLCKAESKPLCAAVISGRPESEEFGKAIERWKGSKWVKGVRRVLHGGTPAGFCLEKTFVSNIRKLGEWKLSFDLCMRSGELADGAKLARECPDTRFILDHCGNGNLHATEKDRDAWRRGLAEVAKQKNTVCKVSGIVASSEPGKWTLEQIAAIVNAVYEEFGPDRVMFGGDWPVCTKAATLRQWVEALRTVVKDRSEADRRKLFAGNAAKYYGLE